jgi:hypothetical protein
MVASRPGGNLQDDYLTKSEEARPFQGRVSLTNLKTWLGRLSMLL